jgi:hypothetical protein
MTEKKTMFWNKLVSFEGKTTTYMRNYVIKICILQLVVLSACETGQNESVERQAYRDGWFELTDGNEIKVQEGNYDEGLKTGTWKYFDKTNTEIDWSILKTELIAVNYPSRWEANEIDESSIYLQSNEFENEYFTMVLRDSNSISDYYQSFLRDINSNFNVLGMNKELFQQNDKEFIVYIVNYGDSLAPLNLISVITNDHEGRILECAYFSEEPNSFNSSMLIDFLCGIKVEEELIVEQSQEDLKLFVFNKN